MRDPPIGQRAIDGRTHRTEVFTAELRRQFVTLTGHLDSFAEKHTAERAVRRVAGVRGIAVELDVKLSPDHKRTDSEIAQAALSTLRWHALVPEKLIKVEVEDGWVTLTGQVDSRIQLTSAEQGIRSLIGVRGLTNNITVKPRASEKDISAEIAAALTRQAQREASHIKVDVDGGIVTLTGNVHSLVEHDAAVGAPRGRPAGPGEWWTGWRSAHRRAPGPGRA